MVEERAESSGQAPNIDQQINALQFRHVHRVRPEKRNTLKASDQWTEREPFIHIQSSSVLMADVCPASQSHLVFFVFINPKVHSHKR